MPGKTPQQNSKNFDETHIMTTGIKIHWGKIMLFYTIAFAISGLFNSGLLTSQYQKITGGLIIINWSFLPAGIGTLIAAIIAFVFDRKTIRIITLLGNNGLKNIVISLVPVLVFSLVVIYNKGNINEHYYGFAFSFIALLYALTEEIFWRAYLLDALRPLKKMIYSLVIGISWWAWHFRFDNSFDFTWFLLICVVSSFLLCQFANETKSYLTAAGLHSLIIITTSEGEITQTKVISLCVSIGLWLMIGKLWKAKIVSKNI
jgi:membrane protease YdiL (CAAX protease family)